MLGLVLGLMLANTVEKYNESTMNTTPMKSTMKSTMNTTPMKSTMNAVTTTVMLTAAPVLMVSAVLRVVGSLSARTHSNKISG